MKLLIFSFIAFALCSCEKTLSCLVRSKGETSEVLEVGEYKQLYIEGRVDVELVDGSPKTELFVDRSLYDDVELRVDGDELRIKFAPTCKTFKDSYAKVVVSSRNIRNIRHMGEGQIVSLNRLKYPKLFFDVAEEYVSVDIEVDNQEIGVSTRGISKFVFSGKSNWIWVSNFAGDGVTDASQLLVKQATIDHRGTNLIKVNCLEELFAKCTSSGDIWVYSRPKDVTEESTNTGKMRYK